MIVSGTITRGYDGLDRLTSETTPQGSVSYSYDAASRRTKMTVAGQADVIYGYNNDNRLTGITQGSATVAITYDTAHRRKTLTMPNGICTLLGLGLAVGDGSRHRSCDYDCLTPFAGEDEDRNRFIMLCSNLPRSRRAWARSSVDSSATTCPSAIIIPASQTSARLFRS